MTYIIELYDRLTLQKITKCQIQCFAPFYSYFLNISYYMLKKRYVTHIFDSNLTFIFPIVKNDNSNSGEIV